MTVTVACVQPMGETGADTIRTGLLGREILASRSPWMHTREARAQCFGLTYDLFDFADRSWADDQLGPCLAALQQEGFAGVNVTHPFKQAVIAHLDELAPSAANVSAVNAVCFANGRKIGHNTDVTGFARSVRIGLPGERLDHVIQFGAGGAGSATAHALLSLGVRELTLVEGNGVRLAALAEKLTTAWPDATIKSCDVAPTSLDWVDGVVNATPVGMAAHPGTPFDVGLLSSDTWVADVVYFPLETALLRAARDRGCRTLNGKGMAVFQAADAFDLFTGAEADRDRMLASFDAFVADAA